MGALVAEFETLLASLARLEERVVAMEGTVNQVCLLATTSLHLFRAKEQEAQALREEGDWQICDMEEFYLGRVQELLGRLHSIQEEKACAGKEKRDALVKYLSSLKEINRLRDREAELREKCAFYKEKVF